MYKPSKGAVFGLFILAGLGAVAYYVVPSREEIPARWEAASIALQRPLYEEQRQLLRMHLPGLFPVRLTCRFQPAKGEWRTILPGDSVQGLRAGGMLTCSNGDKFHLHANTTARLWAKRTGETLLEVERGWISGTVAAQPLVLSLGADEVEITAKGPTRFLATAHGKDENYLKCLSGEAELGLAARVDEPLLLEARSCAIRVKREGETQSYPIAAGERVFLADLSLAREVRPELPVLKRAAIAEAEADADAGIVPPVVAVPAPASVGAPVSAPASPTAAAPAVAAKPLAPLPPSQAPMLAPPKPNNPPIKPAPTVLPTVAPKPAFAPAPAPAPSALPAKKQNPAR